MSEGASVWVCVCVYMCMYVYIRAYVRACVCMYLYVPRYAIIYYTCTCQSIGTEEELKTERNETIAKEGSRQAASSSSTPGLETELARGSLRRARETPVEELAPHSSSYPFCIPRINSPPTAAVVVVPCCPSPLLGPLSLSLVLVVRVVCAGSTPFRRLAHPPRSGPLGYFRVGREQGGGR